MIIDPNSSSWRERMESEIRQVIINSGGVIPNQTDSSWKARTEELLKVLAYLTISGGQGNAVGGAAANVITVMKRLTSLQVSADDLTGLIPSADGSAYQSRFLIDTPTENIDAGIYYATGNVTLPYARAEQFDALDAGVLIFVKGGGADYLSDKGTYYQVDRGKYAGYSTDWGYTFSLVVAQIAGSGGAAASLSNGIVTVQRRLTTISPTPESLAGLTTSADGSDRASWFFLDNGSSYAGIYHATGDVVTPYQAVSQINGSHLEVGTLIYVESQIANGKGTYYQVDRKLTSDDDAIYSPFIDLSVLEFAIAANTAQIAVLTQQQSSNQSISNQPTPDPLFSSVGLLMPLRGDFIDRSQNGLSIVNHGVIQSADTAKFGTQSAKFESGSYLSFDGAASLNLPGDFLIEAWVYQVSRPTEFAPILECLPGASQGGTGYSFGLRNGKINFYDFVTDHTGNTAIPLGTWTHVAVWKCNSILSLWINGVPDFATTNARNITTTLGNFRLGVNSWQEIPTFRLNGYLQDVRLTKAFRAPILPNNPMSTS